MIGEANGRDAGLVVDLARRVQVPHAAELGLPRAPTNVGPAPIILGRELFMVTAPPHDPPPL